MGEFVEATIDSEINRGLTLGDRDEAVRHLIEAIFNEVLEAEMDEHLQAAKYERTEEGTGNRNGYYERGLTVRVGTLDLRIPRARDNTFETAIFDRYQQSEMALVLAMMEMVINGVSTRKVKRITDELCGREFSKSTVSRLCERLDEKVEAWGERTLMGGDYPFVLVDAIQVKVRRQGTIRPTSALVAVGINDNGYRGKPCQAAYNPHRGSLARNDCERNGEGMVKIRPRRCKQVPLVFRNSRFLEAGLYNYDTKIKIELPCEILALLYLRRAAADISV